MKNKNKTGISEKSDEGFALILTLWVLMIMSVLILTYSMSVNSNIKNASYLKDKIQASAYADGVLYLAAANLIPPDDKKDKNDSSGGAEDKKSDSGSGTGTGDSKTGSGAAEKIDPKAVKWFSKKLGKWYIDPKTLTMSKDKTENSSACADENPNKVTLVCEVYAEDAKFPLNKITQLKKSPTDMSPLVFGAIKDYLKKINEKQSGSNQSQSSSSGTTKTKDKYGSFSCVEQLLEVDNVDADVYDGSMGKPGLKDIMTVFSDGKIYVSKAKAKVLAMVPGISSGAAGQIESQSKGGSYLKSFKNLNSMVGTNSADTSKAKKWLSLIPKYFRIKAKATVQGITCTAECVVKVEKNNIEFVLMKRG